MVTKAASLTNGAGGPSHLGADQFHQLLPSKKFKIEAKERGEQMTVLAKTLV